MITIIGLVAIAYQVLALAAALLRRHPTYTPFAAPVSILKPARGEAPGFYETILSNARQDYPSFELLFGVADPCDPARAVIDRVTTEYPNVRSVVCSTEAPNGKAGSLIDLAREAKGEILVVSDADISVPAGYLSRVIAPLADPKVGLVTCAYRARSETLAGRFEALGVATDFAPSTMIAPFVGVNEFALGSTMAFRRRDLERIGGFEAVADYLADDYQIGHRIHALGLKCILSDVVVETHLTGTSWAEMWRHQVRWARTIRLSRYGGYAGLPVTFATLWALIAAVLGHPDLALCIVATRFAMALGAGWYVLRSSDVLRLCLLIPARDLFGVAVWAAGLVGRTVDWGGERLTLDPAGRIISPAPAPSSRA